MGTQLKPFLPGGGKRDRTADLLHAMQALSQLSYTPDERGRIVVCVFGSVKCLNPHIFSLLGTSVVSLSFL